ncbi:MAG: coproporphyrinogen III oxidase [Opitutales bacterium TMED158]|nr:MAG: coproporphyrinogen III oxidase [Opitutales bacterium TMED158]
MSATTEAAKPTPAPTEAGNYFISNYPPFSFWKPEDKKEVDDAFLQSNDEGASLGLYHHIPFCRKRCHFCYFRVYTDKNASEIKNYLDATIQELKYFAEKPRIAGRKPRFVYFGGGTPSYLSASQLRDLTDQMKAIIPWDEAEEIAFEGEPGTLNPRKVKAIKDIGVTRLSLGVENFDARILEINGRAHKADEVYKAYEAAQAENFDQLNIDLIAGMLDETEENWQRNIEETLRLRPDSVTIYQMEIPYNTTIYKEMKASGALVAPVADWQVKRRWVREAFEALESAGYTITSGYTAVLDPEKTKFLYRDELWSGADLLGLGVASISHIAGVHYQNVNEITQYTDAIAKGDLPIHRAHRTTSDERMIREFLLQMKLGRVSAQYFKDKFGVDLIVRYGPQLEALKGEELLDYDAEGITLRRRGLLCVDNLLFKFFLPEHVTSRIV